MRMARRSAAMAWRDRGLSRNAAAYRRRHPAFREPPVRQELPRGRPWPVWMPPPVRHGVSGTMVPEIRVEVGRYDFPWSRLRFRGLARPGRARLRRDEQRGLRDHVPVGNTGTRNGGKRVTVGPHWRMWSAMFAHSLFLSTSIVESLQLGPVTFCYISCNIGDTKND